MNRRDFFIRIGGTALAVPVAFKLGACGDDNPDMDPDAARQLTCNAEIVNPHGHVLTVTQADIDAGVDIVGRSIQGTSPHDHTVDITVAQLQELSNGGSITITSTQDNAHDHQITITCVQ